MTQGTGKGREMETGREIEIQAGVEAEIETGKDIEEADSTDRRIQGLMNQIGRASCRERV